MERILYAYILTADNGQSPCYTNGIYTLACCKPQIRRMILQKWKKKLDNKTAEVWICGVRHDKASERAYIAYLAKVDKVIKLEEYYADDSPFRHRNDCYYHNACTLYDEGGKLPKKRSSDDIRNRCPELYACNGNEHGALDKEAPLTEYQCRDIYGAAVLLSEHFIHCSCDCFSDIFELSRRLSPAFDAFLQDARTKTQGHWCSFCKWDALDKVLPSIPLGVHKDVRPLDMEKCKSTCGEKEKESRMAYVKKECRA